MQAVAMKRKTTLALWHWSQNLQRKVCIQFLSTTVFLQQKQNLFISELAVIAPIGSDVLVAVPDEQEEESRALRSGSAEASQ